MLVRMRERDANEYEVLATVESGERFPAPWGRTGFRKRFRATAGRRAREVTTYAEERDDAWLVITVVVRSATRMERPT
jgi:hypothetical protein